MESVKEVFDRGKILVVGDLHISDRFVGSHKNYLENCFDCLEMITQSIKKNKITHLICLGDWVGIGLAEKNLKERKNLLRLTKVLQNWNNLLDGNVYTLVGNHDIGKNMTDCDFFLEMGYLKNIETLDVGNARIHMFNYGDEVRDIDCEEDDGKYHIGCFHTNLTIEGLTTWYRGGVGTELSSLRNLVGVSFAIAGHIHNPSMGVVTTSIAKEDISLFYPGCMTRPRLEPNLWDVAYGVVISADEETSLNTIKYDLKPIDEVFNLSEEKSSLLDEVDETFNLESLNDILEELKQFNLNNGVDYTSQIKRVAGLDSEASDMALHYLEEAEATFKN